PCDRNAHRAFFLAQDADVQDRAVLAAHDAVLRGNPVRELVGADRVEVKDVIPEVLRAFSAGKNYLLPSLLLRDGGLRRLLTGGKAGEGADQRQQADVLDCVLDHRGLLTVADPNINRFRGGRQRPRGIVRARATSSSRAAAARSTPFAAESARAAG